MQQRFGGTTCVTGSPPATHPSDSDAIGDSGGHGCYVLCCFEASVAKSSSLPVLVGSIPITLNLCFPSRLTAVVFVLESSRSPIREHLNQNAEYRPGIVRVTNAAHFDAVAIMDRIDT